MLSVGCYGVAARAAASASIATAGPATAAGAEEPGCTRIAGVARTARRAVASGAAIGQGRAEQRECDQGDSRQRRRATQDGSQVFAV